MRVKDEKKHQAIRNAAIDVVIESGVAGASIAKIAKRAGLSQGTIYLYFDSKEDLLRQLYIDIKLDLRDAVMAHFDETASSQQRIRSLWMALFDYAIKNPNRFAYAEYLVTTQMLAQLDDQARQQLMVFDQAVRAIVEQGIRDGSLRAAPYESIRPILTGPLLQLARPIVMGQANVNKKVVAQTFDMIWRAMAA